MIRTRIVLALGLALAVGCGSGGKKAKCEKGWDSYKEMMSAFGRKGAAGEMAKEMESQMDAMKGLFIEQCTSFPDDVVDCIAKGIAADEECQKKLKDAGVGGMRKKKRAAAEDDEAPKKGAKDEKKDEPKKDE